MSGHTGTDRRDARRSRPPDGTGGFRGRAPGGLPGYLAGTVQPGDYAIVHVGFAISKVDEEEARRTFEALREMSQLEELDWMREVAERSLAAGEERTHEVPQRVPRRRRWRGALIERIRSSRPAAGC